MKLVLGTMTIGNQLDADETSLLLDEYEASGFTEVDTAYVYNQGKTETVLGELLSSRSGSDNFSLAGKANPSAPGRLSAEGVRMQLDTSLERLKIEALDLFYLHSPDLETPIDETLGEVNEAYQQGRIKNFGLSNYASWQVAQIVERCEKNGWLKPVCYQGMYNAITRDVERELFKCLADYGLAFYVYNPLAGGLLSGKYTSPEYDPGSPPPALPETGRFSYHKGYPERYWKDDNHRAVAGIARACAEHQISVLEASFAWLAHHSAIADGLGYNADYEHAVVVGASSLAQLQQNLKAWRCGPLPDAVVDAIDEAWLIAQPSCIKYFRP